MVEVPAGVIPVRDLTTREILYGARTTSHRYELLEHDPLTGADSLIGFLDGVEPGGSLSWSSGTRVKKSGNLEVLDIPVAAAGLVRVGDIGLVTTRIRPVLVVEGLPELPLGVYVVTASPEAWSDTGRTFQLELHEKSTVLDQDAVEESFTADAVTPVLDVVKAVVESAGERISVDGSDTRTLTSPLVWDAGTSKLSIVNDLLSALNYNSLWMDGEGAFRATPYERPASRSIRYAMLNDEDGNRLVRELIHGDESIYSPEWNRDRDTYGVPNKVVAVQSGTGEGEPLSGSAMNENPESPFSYQTRGRWIVRPLGGVEVPDYSGEVDPIAATEAFLDAKALQSLIASSAVQAAVSVKCLPIPVELLEAVRFESTPAGIDARHTVRSVDLSLTFDGLMSLELQEVIDL
ncbi:MAG: hypothetical protein WED09_07195 [Homoserinimonas sp.]